ncbi:hypothetical protein [Thioalkalivibrio sp. K90mix]|uniref:hypothetical protein n=1 Tax=Thioalkalivibrio sp. (strain K90mix) TaxID=396595 RepID=UPI000A05A51F|nr:hypothetical protein [Thioalkalivibrio sp. K90mix]
MTSKQLGARTFTVRAKPSGWFVERDDGLVIGMGFSSEKEAQGWLDREVELARQQQTEPGRPDREHHNGGEK